MVIHEIQPALEPFADAIKVRKQLIDASLQYLEKMSAEAGDNVALLRELSSSYLQLARVQGSRSRSNLGDRNAFKASLAKASALADRLLELDPSGHDTLRLAINIASEQAAELSADGRKEEAAAFGNRAVELADRMVTAHPQSSMAQEMLASALFARPGEANMERARKIYEQLLRDKPDHPVFRRNLALTLKNLSGSLYQRRDYRGGLELAIQARDIDQRLSNEDPANQTALLDLAIDWSQMGAGFYNLNNWEKAKAAFEASIAIREKLVAANPKDARPLDRLTWAKADLAEKTMQRGEVATALPILQDASALYARLASFHPLTDGTLQKAATNEYWLGIAQQKRGAARAACGPFARAARMLDSLQQAKPLASQEARIREEIQRALAKCPPAAPSPAAHPGPQKAAVNR
jgi:tetratricopeptide (TPR) repeat protein